MKLKNLTLVILLLLVSNYSKAQFGIRLEYGFNTLLNVNPNELTPYGHSGHQSNEQSSNSFTPSLSYRFNIFKDILNFDVGVGYTRNKYSWDFKYQHRYVGMVDASLYVDLKYLQFPFLVNYKKKLNSNKYLSISGGLSLDVLISSRDNYFDIVLEEIYII